MNDYDLMSAALARGRGETFELVDLLPALEDPRYLWKKESHRLTSREMWRCEWEVIEKARHGTGQGMIFHPQFQIDPSLSREQTQAVRQILASHAFIILFRGAAGTGKSRTLQEIGRAVVASGHPLMVLAPQSQQVRDLQSDGMPAQTLAQALSTRQFPRKPVVILDEAGQVSARDLRSLVEILEKVQGRLILSGDTRQHGPVEAGDAMRAIELNTRLRPAVLRTIRRQDPKLARSAEERRFIRLYRAAVKAAAAGQIADSFDRLVQLDCVRELPDKLRRAAIADEYLAALDRGEKPLVVAQTWEEVHAVNDAIRTALQKAGALGTGEAVTTYQPVDRTEAQKRDAQFYEPGHSAFFLRKYGRYAKGELYEIAGANERGLVLVKDGRRSTVSYRYAKRLTVVAVKEMELTPGDRLQLKANGRSVEGERLHNGELVTVVRIEPTGMLVVTDERGRTRSLAASQRVFVRGYAVTSYASQGKTVDTVILADSGSRAATSAQQWYVSISRGRKRIVVLTPDKAKLRANIQRSGARDLAVQDTSGNASERMGMPGTTEHAREAMELARRHQAYAQQFSHAHQVRQAL